MKLHYSKLLCAIAGMATILGTPPASADDSEVFTSAAFQAGSSVHPNVLFIIDTSGSMTSEVILYDPSQTYSGSCNKDLIYWDTSNDSKPPACTTTQFITKNANRCRSAYLGMQEDGWYNGRMQQLNSAGSSWQNLAAGQKDLKVECELDTNVHGDVNADSTDGGSNKYARNGSGSNRWGNKNSANQITWGGNPGKQRYSVYSGNYINWYTSGGSGTIKTRLQIVQEVASNMIDTLKDVNLGLMRYSNDQGDDEQVAEGGMVTYPVSNLDATSRAAMKTLVKNYVAAGNTPLSETLYEAHQYLAGGKVKYGDTAKLSKSVPSPSVDASRTAPGSKTYKSPMDFSCQKTFIVYLTDGLPTTDNSADTDISKLPDFAKDGYVAAADGGGGASCPTNGPDGSTNGRCLVNLAGYLFNHDMRDGVNGKQNVQTYIVGFGNDIATSKDFLDHVAKAGGGKAYTQNDTAGLTAALQEIFADVASNANSTFVSPTVAVNAFNRTRNLNSLFVSVFAPTNRAHWPGNVKKYQLVDGVIHGKNKAAGAEAVDPETGFFKEGTYDLFNNASPASADGPEVKLGGAASNLPAWNARKLYTYLGGSTDLTQTANRVQVSNTALDKPKIGLSAASTDLRRQEVIEFTLGRDVNDENTNQDFTETRRGMGDPMHSRPAVAIYGGTEAAPIGTVYSATNDGILHAIDMTSGKEEWSFIPEEMLSRMTALQRDQVAGNRSYGLDGDVRVFKYDANNNGVLNTGDKMYLLVGFGRGGAGYYALDVTSVDKPVFLWKKTNATLPMLGSAWSSASVTRVNVKTTKQTDPQKLVAIFGAGYDTSQDTPGYSTDGVGNGLYMLELASGNVLWSAGKTGSGAYFESAQMANSIPSDVTVLDLNGDTYADRMYVGDMGGRIWRFDIWHGQAPGDLVSGGVLANLGAGHLTSPSIADTRRFYYAPDVSLVNPRGSAPYLNIAIGSGYRGHPLEMDVHDRFYSIRDYQPFNRRTTKSYAAPDWVPIADDKLVDVTTKVDSPVKDGENGWKIELNLDGWRGEKVLAESVTAKGVIFFPTFTPVGADKDNPCLAATLNRSWSVYLDTGRPYIVKDVPKPGDPPVTDDPRDRFEDLVQGGIAPGTAIIQTPENKTICLSGVEAQKCVNIGDVTRTFWERHK